MQEKEDYDQVGTLVETSWRQSDVVQDVGCEGQGTGEEWLEIEVGGESCEAEMKKKVSKLISYSIFLLC